MPRDILSEFGRDSGAPQKPGASSGGITMAKPLSYSPPQGPMGIMHEGPGLGGTNLGNCGTQGCTGMGANSSGSPGLHGENRGMGTNRKG